MTCKYTSVVYLIVLAYTVCCLRIRFCVIYWHYWTNQFLMDIQRCEDFLHMAHCCEIYIYIYIYLRCEIYIYIHLSDALRHKNTKDTKMLMSTVIGTFGRHNLTAHYPAVHWFCLERINKKILPQRDTKKIYRINMQWHI